MRFSFSLLALAIGFSTLLISCKKDPCKDIVCENGATCDDNGVCQCTLGHEGTFCQTEMRTKFIGFYKYTETCDSESKLDVIVDPSAASVERVTINNLNGTSKKIEATITTSTTLEIKSQLLGIDTIKGSGSISGKTLSLTYTLKGATTKNCSGTGTQL